MGIDWSSSTVLSFAEFDVAWEMAHLGETPVALELPRHGTTDEERDRVVRDATALLRDRGLLAHARPVPDLEEQMALLARAEQYRDLVTTAPTRMMAVAASAGPRAVLAVRHDDRVALAGMPTDRATAELVGLLGPITPGPGRPVRVPEVVLGEAVTAGGADRERLVSELMRRGMDGGDARTLLRMSSVTGVSQLGASRRIDGSRRRAPYALLVQSTPEGCYRQRRSSRPGAETIVEVGPTDPGALAGEVDELLETLLGSRPPGAARRSPR